MSTDQVVSRYPQEWVEAAKIGLHRNLTCPHVVIVSIMQPARCDDCAIEAVLSALHEVGALAPSVLRNEAQRLDDLAKAVEAVSQGCGVRGFQRDRHIAEVRAYRLVADRMRAKAAKWVGPWVEVPDATT